MGLTINELKDSLRKMEDKAAREIVSVGNGKSILKSDELNYRNIRDFLNFSDENKEIIAQLKKKASLAGADVNEFLSEVDFEPSMSDTDLAFQMGFEEGQALRKQEDLQNKLVLAFKKEDERILEEKKKNEEKERLERLYASDGLTKLISKQVLNNRNLDSFDIETLDYLKNKYVPKNDEQRIIVESVISWADNLDNDKIDIVSLNDDSKTEKMDFIKEPSMPINPEIYEPAEEKRVELDPLPNAKPIHENRPIPGSIPTPSNIPVPELDPAESIEPDVNDVSDIQEIDLETPVDLLDSIGVPVVNLPDNLVEKNNDELLVPTNNEVKTVTINKPKHLKKVTNKRAYIWTNSLGKKLHVIKGLYVNDISPLRNEEYNNINLQIDNFRLNYLNKDTNELNIELANIDREIAKSSLSNGDKIRLYKKLSSLAKLVDYKNKREYVPVQSALVR